MQFTLIHLIQYMTCLVPRSPSLPPLCLSLSRSFEEMEAQITAGMKTPVLSSRPGPEGCAADKGRKRESESLSRTQSTERNEQVSRMLVYMFKLSWEQLSHVLSLLCLVTITWGEFVSFDFVEFMSSFSHEGGRVPHCTCFIEGWDFALPTWAPSVMVILMKASSLMTHSPMLPLKHSALCFAMLTPALLPTPPGAPVVPLPGPCGGPCSSPGHASIRQTVWVWRPPAVPGAWPGWDQPHRIRPKTTGVFTDQTWPFLMNLIGVSSGGLCVTLIAVCVCSSRCSHCVTLRHHAFSFSHFHLLCLSCSF